MTETAPSPAPPSRLTEDWAAVVIGGLFLVALAAGWLPALPSFKWKLASGPASLFAVKNLSAAGVATLIVIAGAVIGLMTCGARLRAALPVQLAAVALLALAAQGIAGESGIKALGLEYVLFALILGMIGGALGLADRLRDAIRTEFCIKTGLVIFGATISFPELLKAGALGLVQALAVVLVVWYFALWLARRLKVDDESAAMLASAVSICGVSAAIAACGVIQGDRRKLSFVTSLVMLVAMPMMVLMPWIAKWTGMPEAVAGAWFGGTLDTSGSVTAAGAQLGPLAEKIGVVVKFSQNVLIGVAALFISIWWAARSTGTPGAPQRLSAGVIWERFPKFVLGFMAASLVWSFGPKMLSSKALTDAVSGWRTFWFAMAFVCIGLETRPAQLFSRENAAPTLTFLGAQAFNVVWTLLLAWLLFSGRFLPAPVAP